MRTVSTFSFCWLLAIELLLLEDDVPLVAPVVEPVVEPVDEEPGMLLPVRSIVPVISTLWPTCGESFDASASRR